MDAVLFQIGFEGRNFDHPEVEDRGGQQDFSAGFDRFEEVFKLPAPPEATIFARQESAMARMTGRS